MYGLRRALIFLTVLSAIPFLTLAQQQQDKEQSKLYMEQAELIMKDTRAMDDARDIMVTAADFDTTNIKANFEAGHMHIETINKDYAIKYFLRIYRQSPDYRFDLSYWVGKAYHYGLDFDNATKYYALYRDKLIKKSSYMGKDKVELKEVERNLEECKNGKEFLANPKNYAIRNVGSEINSEWEDYAPILTADENEMVFTSRRRDGNVFENVADDNKPYEDIFMSTKTNGAWTKAKNVGPTVNIKFGDSGLALSADGQTLFIYRDEGGGDIYICKRLKDKAWGVPEPLPGSINSSYRESSVSVSSDGNTIYFASERPGGIGGSDLYVCSKDAKGEWGRAKNLGDTINTEFDEDGPFIDYDNKTLYFSSKGGKGMGFFDLFKSTLINAETNQWSVPENLGYPINTPDNDNFYVSSKDGKRAYYSSVRDDGFGYDDIYEITVKEAAPVKNDPEPMKEETFTYVVNVVDADNQSPIEASVKLLNAKDNSIIGVVPKGQGVFEFTVKVSAGTDFRLSVDKSGYAFVNDNIKIVKPADGKPVTKTVAMKKLVVGVVSVLRNIYFDFGKASFKQESFAELNKLESMMKKNSGLQVEIAGHTDNIGGKPFNQTLSQMRANAVRGFLTSKGVDPRRVTSKGYGEDKPLASNDDETEGRELNRRVEFKVVGN